jgi:arylsulfatase A-like enzyme
MRRLLPLLLLGVVAVTAALRPAPQQLPHVTVLLSLDGYRADYINRPHAKRLRELAARGARLERMVPVFPSKTFPNHYSIVTGLYPEHHGIVANTMYDSVIGKTFTISDSLIARDTRWWGGEPIWNTAEKQGVKTAAMFWPGSDYEISGRRPSWYTPFNNKYPNRERIAKVLSWLSLPAAQAPRFITLYYSTVDDAGHNHGPASPQVDTAIARVDTLVGELLDGIAARGLTDRVNLIVVSDHGMVDVDTPGCAERRISRCIARTACRRVFTTAHTRASRRSSSSPTKGGRSRRIGAHRRTNRCTAAHMASTTRCPAWGRCSLRPVPISPPGLSCRPSRTCTCTNCWPNCLA